VSIQGDAFLAGLEFCAPWLLPPHALNSKPTPTAMGVPIFIKSLSMSHPFRLVICPDFRTDFLGSVFAIYLGQHIGEVLLMYDCPHPSQVCGISGHEWLTD
jgi:hypothetical protein